MDLEKKLCCKLHLPDFQRKQLTIEHNYRFLETTKLTNEGTFTTAYSSQVCNAYGKVGHCAFMYHYYRSRFSQFEVLSASVRKNQHAAFTWKWRLAMIMQCAVVNHYDCIWKINMLHLTKWCLAMVMQCAAVYHYKCRPSTTVTNRGEIICIWPKRVVVLNRKIFVHLCADWPVQCATVSYTPWTTNDD